jgi:hypothetical protein
MNIITAVRGQKSELLKNVLATVRSVFPTVEVFGVRAAGTEADNVILLAANKSWKPWLDDKFFLPGTPQSGLVEHRLRANQIPEGGSIFTDDWNPVDAVIARQLLAK